MPVKIKAPSVDCHAASDPRFDAAVGRLAAVISQLCEKNGYYHAEDRATSKKH
jgi:hypothetical protein